MKIIVLVAVLLFAAGAYAQEVPKKANTILITVADSGDTAWKNTAKILVEQGFVIKNSDGELGTLSTEPKSLKGRAIISLSVLAQGHIITLTGQMVVPGLSSLASPVDYRGMSGSPALLAWQKMQQVAEAYAGGKVQYVKR